MATENNTSARTFSFRAWHNEYKHLLPVLEISFSNVDGSVDCIQLDAGETVKTWFDGEFILMQSTGLHDKKGKEIFEGDIVFREFFGGGAERGVVKWDGGGFFVNDTPIHTFVCEVIGNVHEHPHLIPSK